MPGYSSRTSRHHKSLARNQRQKTRRNVPRWMSVISENGSRRSRNRNANKNRKSKNFKGGFFEKFVSDLKKSF